MRNLKDVYDTSVAGHYATDDYVFFWSGIFSNWHPSQFYMVFGDHDCVEFNCSEQAMMYIKARLFGDLTVADKIMQTDDPKIQKSLGRTVANFDAKRWDVVRETFVKDILCCKFKQNDDMLKVLLDTGDKIIVEASPYDKIWGIGMGVDKYPEILDQSNWKGENLLGKVLMEVRSDLR